MESLDQHQLLIARDRAETLMSEPARKERTAMNETTVTKQCNVPGCEKTGDSRGLCGKHNYRRLHGKTPEGKAEAERYADAPKRGAPGTRGGSARPKAKEAVASGTVTPAPAGMQRASITLLGGRIVPIAGGSLVLRDGEIVGLVGKDGTARRAELVVGERLDVT